MKKVPLFVDFVKNFIWKSRLKTQERFRNNKDNQLKYFEITYVVN